MLRRLLNALGLAAIASGGLASCGSESGSASSGLDGARCDDVELIVAASSFEASSASVVCGAPGCVIGENTSGVALGGDPALALTNDRVFYLARDTDLVFELDPTCGTPASMFSVHSLAPQHGSANPHDAAAAADGTLLVPLYTSPRLAFVKNGQLDGTLDLSSYDIDGNPQAEAIRIVRVGGVEKAFVALERLDDANELRSSRSSQMLRIDVATRAVEAVIELAGRNPFNMMVERGASLYLSEPGNFDSVTDELAGIEVFDTATSTSRMLLREVDLGASVAEVAVTDDCGVAIVAGPEKSVNPTSVIAFDPRDGRIISSLAAPLMGPTPNYDLQGLAWRGRTLFVGDRRGRGSGYPVHVFEDRGGCMLSDTGRVIDLPQKPVALRPAKMSTK